VNKRTAKLVLIVAQFVYVLFLAVWLFFSLVSIMMFDAPGSEENTGLILLFMMIWMYPLGLIAGIVGSWLAYRKEKLRLAMMLNAIPLLWVLPIAAFVIYANTR